MYKMCTKILDVAPGTQTVDCSLPNKYYFTSGQDLTDSFSLKLLDPILSYAFTKD
jgi:hypothetical protein